MNSFPTITNMTGHENSLRLVCVCFFYTLLTHPTEAHSSQMKPYATIQLNAILNQP